MPDPIRPQDSLNRPQPKPATQPAERAKPLAPAVFKDDTFFRSAPTPEQVAGMQQAVAALDALPPAPEGVLAQRAWLARIADTRKAAELAATGLGNAAFFHNAAPQAAADAASAKFNAFEKQVRDVEELAGLRKPLPPSDPNRPKGQATKVAGQLLEHPLGAILGVAMAPVALLFDGADALSRPSERASYPARLKAYEVRLAAYEKARRDFPIAP